MYEINVFGYLFSFSPYGFITMKPQTLTFAQPYSQ